MDPAIRPRKLAGHHPQTPTAAEEDIELAISRYDDAFARRDVDRLMLRRAKHGGQVMRQMVADWNRKRKRNLNSK